MYLLTLKDRGDDGAYAVANKYGEKVFSKDCRFSIFIPSYHGILIYTGDGSF